MYQVNKVFKNALDLDRSDVRNNVLTTIDVQYRDIELCPICRTAVDFKPIWACTKQINGELSSIYIVAQCNKCGDVYLCRYCYGHRRRNIVEIDSYVGTTTFPSIDFIPKKFSENINNLSPDFGITYNQAFRAERSGLDRICGAGYRKALEILAKDYCIHCSPADIEKIKLMSLAGCIKEYVKNDKIAVLASRCAWLGNDQVHYVKLHDDLDLEILKKLLDSLVNYIDMELNLEFAQSIKPAKL